MTDNKIIAVDIDNTILQCNSFLYKLANKCISPAKKTSDKYTIFPKDSITKTNSKFENFICKMFKLDKMKCMPNSIEFLKFLNSKGFEIVLITSRPLIIKNYTLKQLNKYNIPFSQVVFAKKNKIKACLDLQIPILIDDNLKHCKRITKNTRILAINIFSTKTQSKNPKLIYTKNWVTLYHFIKNALNEKDATKEIFKHEIFINKQALANYKKYITPNKDLKFEAKHKNLLK